MNPTNEQLLAKITAAFSSGHSVIVATPVRVTKFTPRIAARFTAAGYPPFRILPDGNLAVARGKTYNRITHGASGLLVRLLIEQSNQP